MKKNVANQVVKLWNEKHAGSTPSTKTHAEVVKGLSDYRVTIRPLSGAFGDVFYHVEEFVLFQKVFGIHGYITIEDGKCVGELY